MNADLRAHRRLFLQALAATPLAAAAAWAQQTELPAGRLTSPQQALTVMDFEPAAQAILPPAHWGYMASGVDDDLTIKANREGFTHFRLRPRRLVDVSTIDMTTEVFGTTWAMPLFLSPVGGQKMFHSAGEIAVARAARARKVT